MDPQTILNDEKVVRKSIECIQQVIRKLDYDADIPGGVETVKKQFTLNDVINRPKAVLDGMIVYLSLVHKVDWYSDAWSPVRGAGITVRPDPGIVITATQDRDQQVDKYLDKLVARTKDFLEETASRLEETAPELSRSYASTSYEERTFGVRYTVGIPVVAAGAEMEEVVAVQLERLESIFEALALVVSPELTRLVGGSGRNPITGRPLSVFARSTPADPSTDRAKLLCLEPETVQEVESCGLTTTTAAWSDTDRLTVAGPHYGLTRGQAAREVQAALVQQDLLLGEVEVPNEFTFTKYGDLASLKRVVDIKKDTDVINLRKPVMVVGSGGEEPPTVLSCNVNIEAVDNKMVGEATGRTGGYCTGCRSNETDMHGVRAGEVFHLDLGADEVWTHFKELREQLGLVEDRPEDVVIPSGRGDYRQRLGAKHAPLTDQIEFSKTLSVLHATLLRPYEWMKELVVRRAACCEQWGKGRLPQGGKERMKVAKEEFGKLMGPVLGFVEKSAPNQITGNLVKDFLSEAKREVVIDALRDLGRYDLASGARDHLQEEELDNYRRLLQGIAVIGRVVSSSGRVKFLQLRSFSRDLHMFIVETWPWVLFGESLHRLVDHSWEHIVLNGSYGLASKNESSCESVHKFEVYSREHLARKTSLEDNLEDIFGRQHLSGDPGVRQLDKQVKCSRCQSDDHFTVACPLKTMTVIRRDDALVNSFLIADTEEEPSEQTRYMEKVKESWNL